MSHDDYSDFRYQFYNILRNIIYWQVIYLIKIRRYKLVYKFILYNYWDIWKNYCKSTLIDKKKLRLFTNVSLMEFQVRYLTLWLRLTLDKKSWKKYPVDTNAVNAVIRFSFSWIPALHGVNPSLKKDWVLNAFHPCIAQTYCTASSLHCSNKLLVLHHPCIF